MDIYVHLSVNIKYYLDKSRNNTRQNWKTNFQHFCVVIFIDRYYLSSLRLKSSKAEVLLIQVNNTSVT